MADTYQHITKHPVRTEKNQEQTIEETIISLRDENPGITRTQRILYYALGVMSSVLLLRFLLALFGANADNGFVQFVYELSSPFVRPFVGIFALEAESGTARFELETLVATIVYILVGLSIIRLLDLFRKT